VAGYTNMVYRPSINRAPRRVTTLIETNALPLSQATTHRYSLTTIVYRRK